MSVEEEALRIIKIIYQDEGEKCPKKSNRGLINAKIAAVIDIACGQCIVVKQQNEIFMNCDLDPKRAEHIFF